MSASCAELLRQVHKIGGQDVKRCVGDEIRHEVGTMLQWTRDEGGLHALRLGGAQVFLVGRDQHHLVALEPEQPDRHLVDARIGFIGLDQLG